jgi:hypothetical protein
MGTPLADGVDTGVPPDHAGQPATRVTAVFTVAPAKQSPNLRTTDDRTALAQYMRALVVMFASARRFDPDLPLELITDQLPGSPYAEDFAALGVAVSLVPFAHRPPLSFSATFNASLYMLDALAAQRPDERVLYGDPDAVFVRSPRALAQSVPLDTIGAYPISATTETDHNGMTVAQAAGLYGELDGTARATPFTYYGGECYLVGPGQLEALRESAERAYTAARQWAAEGRPTYPRTEEHLFNYALRNIPVTPIDQHVARIWTSARGRAVPAHVDRLTVWHVPAEKGAGLDRLYAACIDPTGWFWNADDHVFRAACARELGIRRRRPRRLARDLIGMLARRLPRR